jgi:hypothetical protein
MAQADQTVENSTFPSVRSDINNNLAALFSQNSGDSAPTVTRAFQPWIDTSSSPPVWKVRNSSDSAWITVGVLDPTGFKVGGVTPIANGGTGATDAVAALAALLPSQGGNAGKALVTSGSLASWGTVASGASVQVFATNGSFTYTPTAGKTTFLVFATGGGGGGGAGGDTSIGELLGGGGGGGGTAVRLYTSAEMGSTAAVTVGAAGTAGAFSVPSSGGTGGTTTFDPGGSGLTITGVGGSGGVQGVTSSAAGGGGGSATNSQFNLAGNGGFSQNTRIAGVSFWAAGVGRGGSGGAFTSNGGVGLVGGVFILEW